MTTSFQISWFGIVCVLLIVISVGAILLKLIAGICRLIVNSFRRSTQDPPVQVYTARIESGFLVTCLVTFIVCIALAGGIFLVRTGENRDEATEDFAMAANAIQEAETDLRRDLRGAFQDLQGARDDLRSAVHGTNRTVRVEVETNSAAATPTSSITDSKNAATSASVPEDDRAIQPAAEKAEDESSGVVLFDVSPDSTVGDANEPGRELLKALHSKLPEKIRRTYALIPLTAPGYPVSAADRSLQAAEVLQAVAASLIAAAEKHAAAAKVEAAASQVAAEVAAQTAKLDAAAKAQVAEAATSSPPPEAETTDSASPVVAEAEEDRIPTWLQNPDGGRVVVETPFQPVSEDNAEAIRTAVNEALLVHLRERTDQTLKPVQDWDQFVHVSLTPEAAKKCVVATYDRKEVISTREGPKTLRRTMALIEFPEDVDNAALAAIRKSVQRHRIGGVVSATGFAWLAVMTGGLLIRFGRRGGRVRKLIAVPAFAVITVPLLMAAVGMTVGMSAGTTFDFPWENWANPVVIGDNH